jgi:hypothetical protein
LKLLLAVLLLIIGVLVAGAYFHFNPAIAIFVVLGFGIYMVRRTRGPPLPVSSGDDTHELKWRQDKEAARAVAEPQPLHALPWQWHPERRRGPR